MYSDSFLAWVVPEFGVRVHCLVVSLELHKWGEQRDLSIVPPATPKNLKVFGLGGGDEVHDTQKISCELSDPGSSLSRQQNQLTPIFPNN